MHPLFRYKWWSWAWDIIPDQNWTQGWGNGVFWTLPRPRELPTLSQGKLKQSGIKCKNISSNEVLIMDIAVLLHQILCVRPTSWLQLRQTHWKKKKASWAGSLWPCYIALLQCYMCFMLWRLLVLCLCVELDISVYVTCVLCVSCITWCVLCFCILSMLHMGFMLDACRSSNSAWHRDDSC